MSAYQEFETEFRSLESLLDALRSCDCKFEVHDQPVELNNKWNEGPKRQAHVVIRGAEGTYQSDVGFERIDGRYVAHINDMDAQSDPAWMRRVKTEYGRHMVRRRAKRMGYRVVERKQQDGSIRMTLSK